MMNDRQVLLYSSLRHSAYIISSLSYRSLLIPFLPLRACPSFDGEEEPLF